MSDKVLTFKDKYGQISMWQEKAVLISLYHTAMCMKFKNWNMQDTATHFGVSIGLVSENIRLAKYIDSKEDGSKLMKIETREAGLKYIERRKFTRIRLDE